MQRACLAIFLSYSLSSLCATTVSQDFCAPDRIDTRAAVSSVNDGDTLRLDNGKRLRLIGINTPELYPNPEQGAKQARAELEQLLQRHQQRIQIRFDIERTDRYGRTLAHVFLPDNTNVTAWLLQRGLGHWITVGKNVAFLNCYRQAEIVARKKHLNLWGRLPNNFVRAAHLQPNSDGFYIITGRLTRVFETDKSVWLELKSGLRLHLDKQNYGNFSRLSYVQKIGGTIMARGWVYTSRNKLVMKISHPNLIQFEPL